jgi:prepilin peptidase CpaA
MRVTAPLLIATAFALPVTAAAAVTDARSARIPNWITLPPLAIAPVLYGVAVGPEYAVQSLASAFISGLSPYLLFRRQAMGGGDVKLFAAIGAVTGLDLFIGLQIQLIAFSIAMFAALLAQAWKGRLLATLASVATMPLNKLLPRRFQLRAPEDLRAPVRLGGSVLLATIVAVALRFSAAESGL